MVRTEDVFIGLFSTLRDLLKGEPGVGLALKAEGQALTLRIRSEQETCDERRPYFAVVVGLAAADGAFRVSYKPSGLPLAPKRVTIVDADSAATLPGLILGYLETERRRLADFRHGN